MVKILFWMIIIGVAIFLIIITIMDLTGQMDVYWKNVRENKRKDLLRHSLLVNEIRIELENLFEIKDDIREDSPFWRKPVDIVRIKSKINQVRARSYATFNEAKIYFDKYILFCEKRGFSLYRDEIDYKYILGRTEDLLHPEKMENNLQDSYVKVKIEMDEMSEQYLETSQSSFKAIHEAVSLIDSIRSKPRNISYTLKNVIAITPKEETLTEKDLTDVVIKAFQENGFKVEYGYGNALKVMAPGAATIFIVPSAIKWMGVTFGTASTGTAISTLHGAASTNALYAWIGGGALKTGGKGIIGGQALLSGVATVGWCLCAAGLLIGTYTYFKNDKRVDENLKIANEKRKQIHSLDLISSALNNKNTESEVQKDKVLSQLSLLDHIRYSDYTSLNEDQKSSINSLAEATKNLYDLLNSEINFEAIA